MKPTLKFIALSGTIDVTENLYVYEYGDDMMIVDCGVGFPDLEMPGVELVLPDFSYIVKNKSKLRGIVLSQGHDDHVGALPFLLKELSAPIWCTPLVREFLKVKFKDYKVMDYKLNSFNPDRDVFEVGPFKISSFRVTHSVPDTVGLVIDTPEGRIFHVAEHKMDQTSADGMSFDIPKSKQLAAEKPVLCLMSDCLGSNSPGMAPSGLPIEDNIFNITKDAHQAVYMTAISSSIGRFQQMLHVAQKVNRKVILVGRSIQSKIDIAHELGYLKYLPDQIIDLKEASKYNPSKLIYIIAGCYGQPGSSVYRLALGEHEKVEAKKGDTFIFSADPGPAYSKESQDFIVDHLIDLGVDVHYYDLNEGLHVSGHGGQEDIKELFKIVKPKYYIPTGGTIRYMKSYEKLAVSTGAKTENVFRLKPGESVIFENGEARRGESIQVKEILVHGLGIGDIGKVVLEDRTALGKEGVVVAAIKVNRNGKIVARPELTSRGFVFEPGYGGVLDDAAIELDRSLQSKKLENPAIVKNTANQFLEKYFFDKTRRHPMILPVVVEV
ncbi:MAG TPA: ribonuclease J [Patescibacteria group bacterium]|nr:ribonuclease J [Patescibacteria group bacterium]